jgi:hypothetical protein
VTEKPPSAIDEEQLKILTEAVKDLGFNWSPLEQPAKSRMDMLQPEVQDEISRFWHFPYSARAQTAGLHLLSSLNGADRLGYTKPPPVKEPAHLGPTACG